jgi:hypothetical protein
MRIMKTFTIRSVQVTVPGATYKNSSQFLLRLHRHGYITKIGGYKGGNAGDAQNYVLARGGSEPVYPTICDLCGWPISTKICDRGEKKEREKEKENVGAVREPPAEAIDEVTHDAA